MYPEYKQFCLLLQNKQTKTILSETSSRDSTLMSGLFRLALITYLNTESVWQLETKLKNVALFPKVGEREGEGLKRWWGELGHYGWFPGNKGHAGISNNSRAPIFCRHVTVFVMNKCSIKAGECRSRTRTFTRENFQFSLLCIWLLLLLLFLSHTL